MVQKCSIVVAGTFAIICLALGIGGPFLINYIINTTVVKQVTMSPENKDLWSEIPGKSGVDIYRNFTFLDFQNPREVIFQGAIPEFVENGEYTYYERQNFTNLQYNEDKSKVDYLFYEFFPPFGDTTGNEKVQGISVGSMGAWFQMKYADKAQVALNGLNMLLSTIRYQIRDQVLGNGLTGLSISLFSSVESAQKQLKKIKGLSQAQIVHLTTDKYYSLADKTTITPWVHISYIINEKGNTEYPQPVPEDLQGTFTLLQNYFALTSDQMYSITSLMYNGHLLPIAPGIKTAYSQTFTGHYCDKNAFGNCDSATFTALQWSTQGVTMYPPSLFSSLKTESVASVNSTVFGYPEISYYYNNIFKNKNSVDFISDGEEFENQFVNTNEDIFNWALQATKIETDPKKYVTSKYALQNIGNLRKIFKYGEEFDQLGVVDYNSPSFQKLKNQVGLPNNQSTYIFWKYLNYFVKYLVEMSDKGGSAGAGSLGVVVGTGLAGQFYKLQQFLLPTITGKILAYEMKSNTCMDIFNQSPFDSKIATNICTIIFDGETMSEQQMTTMFQICTNQNIDMVNDFQTKSGCSSKNLDQFCTQSQKVENTEILNFGNVLYDVSTKIRDNYGCTQYSSYCSNFEFAALQWASSSITKKVPQQLQDKLVPTNTITNWFPDEFPVPFENGWFADNFYDKFYPPTDGEDQMQVDKPTLEQATDLLSYDKLFAGPLVTIGMLWETNGSSDGEMNIQNTFYYKNEKQFANYMRYLALEVSFGGFMIEKTVSDFLFGYDDKFITIMKTMNPQEGGDPSLNPEIALCQPNQTQAPDPNDPNSIFWKQQMNTGAKNIDDIRQYTAISDQEIIAVAKEVFDGENIYWTTYNPYAEEVKLMGTDGVQSAPGMSKDEDVYSYIWNIYNGKYIKYNYTVHHNGLDCYRRQPQKYDFGNSTVNPENAKYYSFGPSGLQNMSTIMGAPIYNSQSHFYLGDEELYSTKNITIKDKNGNLQFPTLADQTYVDSEIYSGTTLSVLLNMQINYQMTPDLLFPVSHTMYLPIYYMRRGTTWTDSQIDAIFKPLKLGLGFKLGLLIGGLVLAFILGTLTIVLGIKYKKQKLNVKRTESELQDTESQVREQLLGKEEKSKNKINPTYSEFDTSISGGGTLDMGAKQ